MLLHPSVGDNHRVTSEYVERWKPSPVSGMACARALTRKDAMFWLGQSKDDRALAFFEEVLTG